MKSLGLYIHIPFCVHRCAYCDFVTYAGNCHHIPEYVQCVCKEIRSYKNHTGDYEIQSVYFGGGTPSLLSPLQVEQVLTTVKDSLNLARFPEITLEANPGTEVERYAQGYLNAGINRISLGVQSTVNRELKALERIHTYEEAVLVIEELRKIGFRNINLDLIYGLPAQTLASWKSNLASICDLKPQHLSLYCLTLEPSTKLGRKVDAGLIHLPDEDKIAEMYSWAMHSLEKCDYEHYEISNWALRDKKQDFRSKHNLQYWRAEQYLGIGAGAHGYFKNFRTENVHRIPIYLDRMNAIEESPRMIYPALYRQHRISKWESMQETMMLGLRLTLEGVDRGRFLQKYGIDPFEIFSKQIQRLEAQGVIERGPDNECVRLTTPGRLVGNAAFREFVGLPEPKGLNIR